jgi:hypothetical protein
MTGFHAYILGEFLPLYENIFILFSLLNNGVNKSDYITMSGITYGIIPAITCRD